MLEVEKELKACLNMAVDKMKELHNKGEIPNFQPGDLVFLKARNIKERIQARDKPTELMTQKLRKKRIRPFKVLKKFVIKTTFLTNEPPERTPLNGPSV